MAECNNDDVMERLQNEVFMALGLDMQKPQKLMCQHHCHCGEGHNNGLEKNITKHYLRTLFRDARNKRQDKRLKALKNVKKILSSDQHRHHIDDFIKGGFIPVFIECLSEFKNPPLQYEAAWALTNICGGTPEQTQAVVSAKAVPVLVKVLWKSSDPRVWDQVIWTLGNIICESPQLRDEVISLNFVTRLVDIAYQTTHVIFMRRIVWVIAIIGPRSNLEPPVPHKVLVELLPVLKTIIKIDDVKVAMEGLDTLCQIMTKHINHNLTQSVIDAGILPNLIPLLLHDSNAVQLGALCALGCVASGTDDQVRAVLDTGAFNHIPFLLCVPEENIRKQTLCLLTCLTKFNGIKSIINIETIIETTGLVPGIIMNLKKGSLNTQCHALIVINHMIQICDDELLKYIMNEGIVEALCSLLIYDDIEIIILVLKCLGYLLKQSMPDINALTDIIEECGGLEKIEKLQDNENDTVYRLSFDLIKLYFSEESD